MLIKINELTNHIDNKYDVFIASASYENRCLSTLTYLQGKVDFDYKLVSLSLPHKTLIVENLKKFEDWGFTIVEVDNTDQLFTIDNFLMNIVSILNSKPNASFLVDVTAFTRQTLLILMRLLRTLLSSKNKVDFLYTSAKEYAPGLKEADKWLTRGVLQVTSIFGYLGTIRPSRPYHLIVLMGYEVERASTLINEYEPSKISIGFGNKDSSITTEHYKLNVQRLQELKSEFPTADSFEFSCIDVEECAKAILTQASKYSDFNIIVSPMNNKLSTLATSIAAFQNEEIQVAVSIPAVYNTQYSIEDDNCYVFQLNNFIKNK